MEKTLYTSKSRSTSIEIDDGKQFENKFFTCFSNKIYVRRYSGYTSKKAASAERCEIPNKGVAKNPILERVIQIG